jgi:CDP-diacylglycerol---serine O-phosphatidyltransferase
MPSRLPALSFVPLLMTAANLVCGFAAVLTVVTAGSLNGAVSESSFLGWATFLIVAAGVFDVLDGRLARLLGGESSFGREFDSLADLISFGIAPAVLAYQLLLKDLFIVGSIAAATYVVAAGFRLARFNADQAPSAIPGKVKTSRGLPVPFPAGGIGIFIWFDLSLPVESQAVVRNWVLPPLLLFASAMMVSNFRYRIGGRLRSTLIVATLVAFIISANNSWHWLPPFMIFVGGLVYAFLPPFLSVIRRRGE